LAETNKVFLTIEDWPSHAYRGLMLDVARTYYPLKTIQQLIDSLVAAKINTLHLHLTDGDAFRIKLDGFPNPDSTFYT